MFPYISLRADKENLCNNQECPLQVIMSFILVILMCDSGVMLWGKVEDILSIKKLFAPFLARASGRSFSTFHRSNFAINEIDASQFLNHTSSSPKPTSLVENTYGDRKNFLLLPVNYLTIPIRFFWVPLALYRPLGCVDPDPVLINVKEDISG